MLSFSISKVKVQITPTEVHPDGNEPAASSEVIQVIPHGEEALPSRSLNSPPPLTLETLSVELILLIGKHLKHVERASLALASKALIWTVGTGILTMTGGRRVELLRLLEKDGILPNHIVCPDCPDVSPPDPHKAVDQISEDDQKLQVGQPAHL